MAIVKRLQKSGNSVTLALSPTVRELLNVEEGDEVALEVVGDTLLVRKVDAPKLNGLQVLAGMEALESTVEGASGMSEREQRFWLTLKAFGPIGAEDLALRLGWGPNHMRKVLAKHVRAGRVVAGEEGYSVA